MGAVSLEVIKATKGWEKAINKHSFREYSKGFIFEKRLVAVTDGYCMLFSHLPATEAEYTEPKMLTPDFKESNVKPPRVSGVINSAVINCTHALDALSLNRLLKSLASKSQKFVWIGIQPHGEFIISCNENPSDSLVVLFNPWLVLPYFKVMGRITEVFTDSKRGILYLKSGENTAIIWVGIITKSEEK